MSGLQAEFCDAVGFAQILPFVVSAEVLPHGGCAAVLDEKTAPLCAADGAGMAGKADRGGIVRSLSGEARASDMRCAIGIALQPLFGRE